MAFNTAAAYASGFDSGKYGFKSLGEAGLLSEDGKALMGSIQAQNQALAGNLAAKALGIEGDLKEREMINDVLMATLEQTAKEKKNNLLVNLMTVVKSGGSSSILSIIGVSFGSPSSNAFCGVAPQRTGQIFTSNLSIAIKDLHISLLCAP